MTTPLAAVASTSPSGPKEPAKERVGDEKGHRGQPHAPVVAAIVVTFRRKEMLRRCVEALLSQDRPPDRILVVDNGQDLTLVDIVGPQSEGAQRVTLLRMAENLGPAGGFAEGIRKAMEDDLDWLWLMDDDVIPRPGALAALLPPSREDTINWPLVLDSHGVESVFPAWAGLLVHRNRIEAVGLPRSDLFWWAEDTEFIRWRLQRQQGMEPVVHRNAVVDHLHPERARVKPAWKYYYEVRNEIYVGMLYKKKRRYWRIPRNVARQIARVLLLDRKQVGSKLKLIARGASDGWNGRLGKTVDPARDKA